MPKNHDLSNETQINKEHRLKVLNLKNKILQARLDQLTSLKHHYENYWLKLDLERYEAKMTYLTNKAKFLTYQSLSEKIPRLREEARGLDEETAQLTQRLEKFRSLDPQLLATFRSLKEEIECQEMLIKISEGNNSQHCS